jgi:hypothetical protein
MLLVLILLYLQVSVPVAYYDGSVTSARSSEVSLSTVNRYRFKVEIVHLLDYRCGSGSILQ